MIYICPEIRSRILHPILDHYDVILLSIIITNMVVVVAAQSGPKDQAPFGLFTEQSPPPHCERRHLPQLLAPAWHQTFSKEPTRPADNSRLLSHDS